MRATWGVDTIANIYIDLERGRGAQTRQPPALLQPLLLERLAEGRGDGQVVEETLQGSTAMAEKYNGYDPVTGQVETNDESTWHSVDLTKATISTKDLPPPSPIAHTQMTTPPPSPPSLTLETGTAVSSSGRASRGSPARTETPPRAPASPRAPSPSSSPLSRMARGPAPSPACSGAAPSPLP